MRYPLSYMIYSAAFQALPQPTREAIYRRLSDILSGRNRSAAYRHLSAVDRQALREIVRDTLPDGPSFF
jgi:hypothetical protein